MKNREIAEMLALKKLIETFPTGILSIVSDTFDFFNMFKTNGPISFLKEEILGRDGKLVFRGDSGDPVDIICGTVNFTQTANRVDNYNTTVEQNGWKESATPEMKGQIELLWDCFGGTVNDQGYKVLNPKVGAIYGDGINFERATQICERLKAKGFASTNIVFGWGSWSMGMCSRDSQGCAVKATYIEKQSENGIESIEIFKEPKTDPGKKSAKGLLRVIKNKTSNELLLEDQCTWDEVNSDENQLKEIFENGKFLKRTTLTEIRERVNKLV